MVWIKSCMKFIIIVVIWIDTGTVIGVGVAVGVDGVVSINGAPFL